MTLFLVNYIRKTYVYGNDIATALERLEPYDVKQHRPKLQVSENDDDDERKVEDKENKMEFKAKLD